MSDATNLKINTDSQCRDLIIGMMCDERTQRVTMRAAVFWNLLQTVDGA